MINTEILLIADSVAREKSIPKNVVLEAMEKAIQIACKKKYGNEQNIKVDIDRKSGEINIYKVQVVVAEDDEEALDGINHILLKYARLKNPDAKVGDEILEPLPPLDPARNNAQSAKQIIINELKNAVLEREFIEFESRVNENVNGAIKRVETRLLVVDLGGKAEAVIEYSELLPKEVFSVNDRIRACIKSVKRDNKSPQIYLSRTSDQFLVNLFAAEVPEMYEGTIEIQAVAREPGSRAKIAVYSKDSNLDPVGSCVGIRGSRVQAVTNELNGEKIDIINWSSDPATFVVNALAPAEVSKVVIDENKHSIDVVVPNNQLSLAIGRRGQNVRLANMLTGWKIDVLTDDQESKRRLDEFNASTKLFIAALDVDEMIAQLLVAEGFTTIEEIAEVSITDLSGIQGFDESVAQELKSRAEAYLNQEKLAQAQKWRNLGVSPELAKIPGLNNQILIDLGINEVKTLKDLADLSRDEFLEYCPNITLSDEQIDKIILDLRKKAYKD